MANQGNFIINLSILFRNTQKFFDKVLVPYDIGAGQLIFLLCINENEGLTMQELTNVSEVDKGTTTKSVQRLIDQGYVKFELDEQDHRVKHLYTTEKATTIMNVIYDYRMQLRNMLAEGVEFSDFEEMLDKATANSRDITPDVDVSQVKIGGLQKFTLLDYPGLSACTIFLSGCNYKCPFCHNRDLVFIPENVTYLSGEEVFDFLKKRRGLIDGVCISGGEPLLQDDLIPFFKKIKKLGYKIKLDTNGAYPEKVKELVDEKLIDMVAMDIKNTKEKYAETVGMNEESFNIKPIEETIEYLKKNSIDYELRTTVVKELHTKEDLVEIAKWIAPCEKYYLQPFVDSGNIIQEGLTSYSDEELQKLLKAVQEIIPTAQLRGFKEGVNDVSS